MHESLCAGSLEAYDQSLSAAPKCAAVYCNKAAALAKLERHEEAIAAAKQALSLNKNYSKVSFVDGHHLMKVWHAGKRA
jgi:tetratricopeptide (TPR) repeat protein